MSIEKYIILFCINNGNVIDLIVQNDQFIETDVKNVINYYKKYYFYIILLENYIKFIVGIYGPL